MVKNLKDSPAVKFARPNSRASDAKEVRINTHAGAAWVLYYGLAGEANVV